MALNESRCQDGACLGGISCFCSKSGRKTRIDNNGSAFVPDDTMRYEIIHYYCLGDKME